MRSFEIFDHSFSAISSVSSGPTPRRMQKPWSMLFTLPSLVETEAEETRWINARMVFPSDDVRHGSLGSAGMIGSVGNDIAA